MNHNSVAKSVRLHKEDNPDLYCSRPGCLYRTNGGDCSPHFREDLQEGMERVRAHYVSVHAPVAGSIYTPDTDAENNAKPVAF